MIDVVRSPKSASADAAGCVGVVEFGNAVSLVVANVPVLFGIVIVLSAVGS